MVSFNKIGIVGYGEVGQTFTEHFANQGYEIIVINRTPEDLREQLVDRPIEVANSITQLAERSDLVISCTWPETAVNVAEQAATGLTNNNFYFDMNSISPRTTQTLNQIIKDSNGTFLKGVIMGAAAPGVNNIRLIIAGYRCEEFVVFLHDTNLPVESLGENSQKPAALKMFCSLITKGIRGLFIEALLPARTYDLNEETIETVSMLFEERTLDDWITNSLVNTTLYAERRTGELEQVVQTVEDVGLDAPMTKRTLWLHQLIADKRITGNDYREILELIESHLQQDMSK